ncbi:MAG: YggS family pyridoxal phosphate-dependent enzyme [Eubacterium sp.]|jgi:pyridoxal phosphate enzyme, YggS family|nr:YggS family pyridoxal phosphate-dependent enzyme [Eubacterium sp.]
MIEENLKQIEENIQAACKRAGRERSEVTLIAVGKTKPVDLLNEAFACGCREFGENKVQEMTEKQELMSEETHWHMIGHLQRNKVKYLAPYVTLIHSVDTYRLAEEISIHAQKNHRVIPVLIEVNIAEEESKFGIAAEDTIELIRQVAELKGVKVKGLMTIAPYVEDPEENRHYFRQIKQLSVDIDGKNIDNVDMSILSMGMTGDYTVAIEEGATMVRVGTGIFGERNYLKSIQ